MGRFLVVALMVAGCGSVNATSDASGDSHNADTSVGIDAACGGAGQACCASSMCSADLTCTTSDLTCRASQLFVAGAQNGLAIVARGSGTSFTVDQIGQGSVSAIWGTAANDVWVIAIYNDPASNAQKSYARHWNGTAWGSTMPFSSDGFVYALWGSASDSYWAFTNSGYAYHWNGSTWGIVQPVDGGKVLQSAWGAGPLKIWAFASNRVSYFDGAWTTSTRSDFSAGRDVTGLHATGEMWAGGADTAGSNPAVLHTSGLAVTVEPLSTRADCHSVTALWPGPNDVWAASAGLINGGSCTVAPTLYHHTTAWTEVTGVVDGWLGVTGMWGTSSKDVYLAGRDPNAVGTLLHYDGTAWTPVYNAGAGNSLGFMWGAGGPN